MEGEGGDESPNMQMEIKLLFLCWNELVTVSYSADGQYLEVGGC